jgi:LCP family protein required for cell wall assembly
MLLFGAFVTVCLVVAAGLALYAYRTLDRLERVPINLAAASDEEPQNYLVVGSDSREVIDADAPDADAFLGDGTGGQRADSIFIVRAYPEGDRLDILAFPRDLWVDLPPTDADPAGSEGRINGTYNEGPQYVVDTLGDNFDLEINHYVEVDFRGFESLVDVVDGVPMFFENAVRDTHSGLLVSTPGCVTLDGEMALAYARSRHLEVATDDGWVSDPTGDLGRITRQQEFLRASMGRFVRLNLGDVFTVKELVDGAVDHVRLDPELGLGELVSLGERIGTFEDHAITTYQMPTEAFRTSGGADVLRMVEAEAEPILSLFRGEVDHLGVLGTTVPATPSVPPTAIAVDVLNGSGIDGQAGAASDGLAAVGFTVGQIGDSQPVVRTQVWHSPDGLAAANVLVERLSGPAELVPTTDLSGDDLVLITGPDFGSVRASEVPATTVPPGATATDETAGESERDAEPAGLTPAAAPDAAQCG